MAIQLPNISETWSLALRPGLAEIVMEGANIEGNFGMAGVALGLQGGRNGLYVGVALGAIGLVTSVLKRKNTYVAIGGSLLALVGTAIGGLAYQTLKESVAQLHGVAVLRAFQSAAIGARRQLEEVAIDQANALEEQGAAFLRNEVLDGAGQELKESFAAIDAEIIPCIFSKAVFHYAFGNRQNENIPDFFRPSTRAGILALRQENVAPNVVRELQSAVQSLDAFNRGPAPDAFQVFTRLRLAAFNEIRSPNERGMGMLFRNCWQRAIHMPERLER